jgi:hypothetical protein
MSSRKASAITAVVLATVTTIAGCGSQHAEVAAVGLKNSVLSASDLTPIPNLPAGSKAGVYLAKSDQVAVATFAPAGSGKTKLVVSLVSSSGRLFKSATVPVSGESPFTSAPVAGASADGDILVGFGRTLLTIDPDTLAARQSDIPESVLPSPAADAVTGGIAALADSADGVYLTILGSAALLRLQASVWQSVTDLPVSGWLGSKIIVRTDGSLLVDGFVGSGPAATPAVAVVSADGNVTNSDHIACLSSSQNGDVCVDPDGSVSILSSNFDIADEPLATGPMGLARASSTSQGQVWYWYEEQKPNGRVGVVHLDGSTQTQTFIPMTLKTFDSSLVSRTIPQPSPSSGTTARLGLDVVALVPISGGIALLLTSDGVGEVGGPTPNYAGAYLAQAS